MEQLQNFHNQQWNSIGEWLSIQLELHPFLYREAGFGCLLSEWGKSYGVSRKRGYGAATIAFECNLHLAESSVLSNTCGVTITSVTAVTGQKGHSVPLAFAMLRLWPWSRQGQRPYLPVQYWGWGIRVGKWHWEGLNEKHMSSVRWCTQHRHLEQIQVVSSHAYGTHHLPRWRTAFNRWGSGLCLVDTYSLQK